MLNTIHLRNFYEQIMHKMIGIPSILFILLLVNYSNSLSFDWETGGTAAQLSAYMYCNTSDYLTIDYNNNPLTDTFFPTRQINDPTYDIDGVIGFRHTDESIYIVIRGSQSERDWMDDLRVRKMDESNNQRRSPCDDSGRQKGVDCRICG